MTIHVNSEIGSRPGFRKRWIAVGCAALLTAGAAATTATAATGNFATLVSQGDPYADCNVNTEPGAVPFPSTEVEPGVAVDPSGLHVVGVFQQDRWDHTVGEGSKGIVAVYSSDGGRTFRETPVPLTLCAPAGLPFQRAHNPSISSGPDGTMYAESEVSDLDNDTGTQHGGIGVTVSTDYGATWHNTQALDTVRGATVGIDKPSITADPNRPGTAYLVWRRFDVATLTGVSMFSVTHDWGATWSTPQTNISPGPNQQYLNTRLLVSRQGTLYEFTVFLDGTVTPPSFRIVMVKSIDGGQTWSGTPTVVAADSAILDTDPNNPSLLQQTASGFFSPAIDPETGELYIACSGTDFTNGKVNQIQLVSSVDGGATWSAPMRITPPIDGRDVESFMPTIAVTQGGIVGIMFHDFRDLTPTDSTLPTSTLLTTSPRGGNHFGAAQRIAPDYDRLQAPYLPGQFPPHDTGNWVGATEGLASQFVGFRAMFAETNTGQPDNRTDMYTGLFFPVLR